MVGREVRIEEGRNYIGEDRVDKMVVTIKLVILAEECGGVSRRREVWRCFKTARSVEVFRREVWRCFGEKCGGVSRRREVWRCFKTARSVEVFQDGEKRGGVSARSVEVFQDGEKSADGWARTRATQTPQRAERRQYETKVSMG